MNAALIFQYFIIAGLINVSLFAFLLLTRKKNNAASFLLIVFMLLVSFQALLNAFDTRAFFLVYPFLSRISWLLPSLFGPLIYLFTKKITDAGVENTGVKLDETLQKLYVAFKDPDGIKWEFYMK